MQITIDTEFKRLIPALLPEEFKQLEANILLDGEIKEPLAIWKTKEGIILLDGHNRFRIAEKNNLKYSTTEIELIDRDHALLWIGEHQLGRRNLDDDQRAILVNKVRQFRSDIEISKQAIIAGKASALQRAENKQDRGKSNGSDTIYGENSLSVKLTKQKRLGQKPRKVETEPRKPRTAPNKPRNDTRKAVSKEFNVAERKLRKAQEIENKPALSEMVSDKKITLIEAKKISSLTDAACKIAIKAVEEGKSVREAVREAKKDDYNATVAAAKPKELEGTYRIIYADPPWKYVGLNQADEYGHAERHYDCLDDDQLKKYKISGKRLVRDMIDKNAVLFLWVTSPLLERCFAIIEAWGFEYKSSFVWDKVKHNMGHYNSVRHELLLIATKGSCKPDVSKLVDSVQSIERSIKHSEKPEEFRKIIENLYDHGRKLELFRRGKAPDGWDTEGNEAS